VPLILHPRVKHRSCAASSKGWWGGHSAGALRPNKYAFCWITLVDSLHHPVGGAGEKLSCVCCLGMRTAVSVHTRKLVEDNVSLYLSKNLSFERRHVVVTIVTDRQRHARTRRRLGRVLEHVRGHRRKLHGTCKLKWTVPLRVITQLLVVYDVFIVSARLQSLNQR